MTKVVPFNNTELASAQPSAASSWWPAALAAASLPLVVSLLAFAMIPTDRIRTFIDSRSPKGHASTISPFVADMQMRALIAAAMTVGLAVLILLFRRPVAKWIGEVKESFSPAVWDFRDGIHDLFTRDRLFTILALLFTLHGAAIRLVFINHSMLNDESNSYLDVHDSLGKDIATYTTTNNHVFSNILIRLSTTVFGSDPWAIRLPIFLAGVLIIPATYLAVRALFNSAAGLVAAGLVSSSPYLILYSVNARGYSIICLLTLLACVLCCYLLRNRRPIAWLGVAILIAFGFYTVPIMLMPCAVGAVWMGLSIWREPVPDARWRYWRDMVVCMGLSGLLISLFYLPILIVSGAGALLANKYVSKQPWLLFFQGCKDQALELMHWENMSIPLPLVLVVLALVLLAWICYAKISRFRVSWVWTAIPVLAAVVIYQRAYPFARLWTFAFPFYYALAGAGLVLVFTRLGIPARSLALACFTALVIYCGVVDASILRTQEMLHDRVPPSGETDAPAMAEFFKTQMPQGGLLFSLYPDIPVVEYYFRRAGLDRQYLVWHGSGPSRPFTFVYLLNPDLVGDDSLDMLNTYLAQRKLRPLRPDELIVLHRFPLATVYRLADPTGSKESPPASDLLAALVYAP